MRLGLVGYGAGGRYFHAPFVVAAQGVQLAGVVTRSPDRRAELAADFPGVPAYDSLAELIAAGVDALTITTPPQTRRELVLEAIAAEVPTIADKPFAPNADGGRELVAEARAAGVPLTVFHNRRWDADIRTLAAVLKGGELGELWAVESRFDLDDPATLEVGPAAGLLRDLGSHLADQMLWLLGPARSVFAELDYVDLDDGRTDCRFAVSIEHASGVRSRVSSSKINHIEERELRAYGSAGSYLARGTDVQAQAIFAGRRPVEEGDKWGYDAPEHWGILNTAAGSVRVPSEQGAYQDYYTRFAAALRGTGDFPVPAPEAVHTWRCSTPRAPAPPSTAWWRCPPTDRRGCIPKLVGTRGREPWLARPRIDLGWRECPLEQLTPERLQARGWFRWSSTPGGHLHL